MRVKAYMAAYYLAQAVYQSYMSLFYRARGMDAARLGVLYALRGGRLHPRATALWRGGRPRARPGPRFARALLLSSAALLLLQAFARDAFALFALAALFGFAYTPVQPIGDALALERLAREGKPFGPARLMGGAGLRGLGARLRLFARRFGEGKPGGRSRRAALMLVALFCSFLLGGERRPRGEVRPLRLLRERKLLRLLLFILPAQVTMGYFYAFFPTRFLELPGATGALLGWANLVSALAEIPFLLVGDRLFARWDAAGVTARR